MAEEQKLIVSGPLSPDEVKARTKISEDFYTVFSNQVRIAASATEFRLFFGESYPTATGEIKIIENFSVILTPIQAKATLGILAETVQRMEALIGTIPDIASLQLKETPVEETPQPASPATQEQG